jgi:hypothetical protein
MVMSLWLKGGKFILKKVRVKVLIRILLLKALLNLISNS